MGMSSVEVGYNKIRIDINRFIVIGNSFLEIAFLRRVYTAIEIGFSRLLRKRDPFNRFFSSTSS